MTRENVGQKLTLNLSDDLVNIILVLVEAVICNGEFSVGRKGGTVTVGQVVDNNLNQLLLSG